MRSISIFLFILIAVLSVPTAQGQWLEKVQVSSGAFLEFVPMKYNNISVTMAPPLFYGINISGQYIYTHSNDMYSLGLSPGLTFSFNYNSLLGTSLLVQTPLYLMGRIGANCTNFNESKVGAGIGIGMNFTYMTLPYTDGQFFGRISKGFVAPAALVELTGRFNSAPTTLRFHMNLLPVRSDVEFFSAFQKIPLDFTNFGIGLIYYFNIR